MVREFEIVLGEVNTEEVKFRLDNEYDENGNPVPHREWSTGIDREGSSAQMAIKGLMPTVVHGFEREGSKIPYTLVIFEWSTERLRLDKRFREVTIEAAFGPYFTAGPKYHWERGDVADVTDAIQLSGSRVAVGAGHSRPNAARWVMLENASQKSGVPAFLRTAVLLKRRPKDNGQFLGSVNVSYRVSKFHDFKEVLSKMTGMIPTDKPIVFDPDLNPANPAFLSSNLADVDLSKEFQLISMEPLPVSSRKAETDTETDDAPEDEA